MHTNPIKIVTDKSENGGQMGLRSRLIEFVIRHNLLPARVRWKKSASGVGRLFNDVFNMLDEDNRRKLTKLMYDSGLDDAKRLVEALKVERDMHGCAVAIIAMNCIYGIKSNIARENSNEIIIHATECLWKDKENWTPKVYASIESYDVGLVKGINKNVKYICTKRRSKGDKICEIILKRK